MTDISFVFPGYTLSILKVSTQMDVESAGLPGCRKGRGREGNGGSPDEAKGQPPTDLNSGGGSLCVPLMSQVTRKGRCAHLFIRRGKWSMSFVLISFHCGSVVDEVRSILECIDGLRGCFEFKPLRQYDTLCDVW